MSRFDSDYMMSSYVDDFGTTHENLPVKIQKDAPQLGVIYAARQDGLCGSAKLLSPRYLRVTFSDGRVLKYPMESETIVVTSALLLKSNGAVCMDYVGEKWNVVLGSSVGATLNFTSSPYSNLVSSKEFETGSFDYTSALGITGLQTVKLPYRIPSNDNASLKTCQEAGLTGKAASTGICSGRGIVSARYFTIRANADDGGKVARKALVANKNSLSAVASAIASCAACLSYQGESVRNIHSLI